jgi:hypothetical protein
MPPMITRSASSLDGNGRSRKTSPRLGGAPFRGFVDCGIFDSYQEKEIILVRVCIDALFGFDAATDYRLRLDKRTYIDLARYHRFSVRAMDDVRE